VDKKTRIIVDDSATKKAVAATIAAGAGVTVSEVDLSAPTMRRRVERVAKIPRRFLSRSKQRPGDSIRDRLAAAESIDALEKILKEAERARRASPGTVRKWKKTAEVRAAELRAKETL
jgi:hypothetical protein